MQKLYPEPKKKDTQQTARKTKRHASQHRISLVCMLITESTETRSGHDGGGHGEGKTPQSSIVIESGGERIPETACFAAEQVDDGREADTRTRRPNARFSTAEQAQQTPRTKFCVSSIALNNKACRRTLQMPPLDTTISRAQRRASISEIATAPAGRVRHARPASQRAEYQHNELRRRRSEPSSHSPGWKVRPVAIV